MPKRWFRNWRVKLGAVVGAALLTLGFYGMIQADPLNGASNNTSAGTATNDGAAAAPASASSGTAPRAAAQPTPRPAPVRRVRVSRGS